MRNKESGKDKWKNGSMDTWMGSEGWTMEDKEWMDYSEGGKDSEGRIVVVEEWNGLTNSEESGWTEEMESMICCWHYLMIKICPTPIMDSALSCAAKSWSKRP